MLGLLGLGTGSGKFNTPPLFGLFSIAFKAPARFAYQDLYQSLARVIFRPTTLLVIIVVALVVLDIDFEVVWEEGGEEDVDDNDQNSPGPYSTKSILLDEDLQSLWPREHDSHDIKKKQQIPTTPTLSSSHDPTFSPPLKRKKDPLPTSDLSNKSQRMTDHLTARLATTLHVSSSVDMFSSSNNQQSGLENSRGFYRLKDQLEMPMFEQENEYQLLQESPGGASSEPRRYRKAARNRSNPTTPIHSHPPSPGTLSNTGEDDLLSSFSSTPNSSLPVSSLSRLALESFARNTPPLNLSLDLKRPTRPSSLLMRRESRAGQNSPRTAALQQLAMSTRLALFHQIHTTTTSTAAQLKDMEIWIQEQLYKRDIQDRQSFETAMGQHLQMLVAAISSLNENFAKKIQSPFSNMHGNNQDQEIAVYNSIQTTVDSILGHAQRLCGPDFDMGINRICPQWSMHGGIIEQLVQYVQFVESMRETLSGRFQHPQELSEDLARSQEVIDYLRTIFGESLRNHGLEWRALGLPTMDDLLQGSQEWILNMARVLTAKIRAEVNLALEGSCHHKAAADYSRMDVGDDDDEIPTIGRSVGDVMDLVLQGGVLSSSCLELTGKRSPALVTSWMELAGQYCTFALTKRKEHVAKANKAPSTQIRRLINSGSITPGAGIRKQHQMPQPTQTGVRRGIFLKTMEVFESVNRLLQCVMEMRDEEEHDGGEIRGMRERFTKDGEHEDPNALHGASAASSDQDEAMEIVSASSSSTSLHYDQSSQRQYQRLPRVNSQQQRRPPTDPTLIQRWVAMECLASVLVDIGLELCESMAETLGYENHISSSISNSATTLPDTTRLYTHNSDFGISNASTAPFLPIFGVTSPPRDNRSPTKVNANTRAATAISSLTTFSGGGTMASGTGGVGLIYVQFVVRFVSMIIEFAGQDSAQEQRLQRIHSSVQNLELALSAS
ncbi:hypothetical protein BGZ76_010787 [Entomortierella beljakovae]|nr:hypothetical protein BGZ76_010787 [Entomortierella beljakovae]